MPFRLTARMLGSHGVAPIATVAFVVVVVLIFNVSNWRMMRLLESSKEEDLTWRVRSVTRVVAQQTGGPEVPPVLQELALLPPEAQAELLDDFPDTAGYESLAQKLSSLKQASGLAQILLLTPSGNVVADSNFRFLTGDPLPFSIDVDFLESALEGQQATTRLYEWEGEHFQRDYQPIVDDRGTTVGAIMGSISADYLESMRRVRQQVLRLWLFSSVALLLLGVWLYRTFRYVARLEQHALQRVRVQAMGALAAGMAHELRNPLAIIRALAEESQAGHIDPQLRENAADIIAETNRLSELVNHFLSLSRAPEEVAGEPVNVADEVQRVVQLMRKGAEDNFRIVLELPDGPLWVKADSRALRQMLLNLFLNARDATSTGDKHIYVSLREKRRRAELRIRNTGPRVPTKVLSRAFEPFYTTRQNGTGLGLPISKTIAINMGGDLNLESGSDGTSAVVDLPLTDPPGGS